MCEWREADCEDCDDYDDCVDYDVCAVCADCGGCRDSCCDAVLLMKLHVVIVAVLEGGE